MIIEQEEFQKKLKRINLAYFSDPDRIIAISRGNSVVRQGEQNKRLYLILSGSVVSYRHVVKEDPETASTSHKIYKAFRAGPGDYLGVQSFFSGWFRSSSDLIAETDLELAYIDTATPAVDVEHYGTLLEQFVPAIVHELAARNTRVFDRTAEKEEALRMLHRSEMAATLGQLSAGIAHELNNSLGVLSRKTDFVLETLDNMFRQENAFRYTLYNKGLEGASSSSTSEQRRLRASLKKLRAFPGRGQGPGPDSGYTESAGAAEQAIPQPAGTKPPLLGIGTRPARYETGCQACYSHCPFRSPAGRRQHQTGRRRKRDGLPYGSCCSGQVQSARR